MYNLFVSVLKIKNSLARPYSCRTRGRFYARAKATHANDGCFSDDALVGVLEGMIGDNISLGLVDELGPVVNVNSSGIKRWVCCLILDICVGGHEPSAKVDGIHFFGHLARQGGGSSGTCAEGEGCTDNSGP